MICPDCGLDKSPEEFPGNKRTKTGRATYCKPCHNARNRETVKRLYGDSRHYHYRRKYGIGLDDYNRMVAEQSGLCPICRKRPAVHVDHNHKTGKVRAILCEKCNGGMGLFREDLRVMRNAIRYLNGERADGSGTW
ncbi:MAG: endonuclease VII domain-containing protein [Actinomycetota bacterium]